MINNLNKWNKKSKSYHPRLEEVNSKKISKKYNTRLQLILPVQDTPEHDTGQDTPEHDTVQDTPEHDTVQDTPEHDTVQDTPEHDTV